MKEFKRFLARPTRVPLVLLFGTIGLVIVVMVLAARGIRPADGEQMPWTSLFIAAVLLLLLGAMSALRAFAWMHRTYPMRLHEISVERHQAVRRARGPFTRWLASQRHMPMPLVVVALGWLFAAFMAASVGLFATGVLP